ncbi:MAG: hypothetical protein DHS20C02_01830 [Micavibrio sp.]|nr:MAG: hypothetical protein DHS20C02_01830 [Micavibrio sp.]
METLRKTADMDGIFLVREGKQTEVLVPEGQHPFDVVTQTAEKNRGCFVEYDGLLPSNFPTKQVVVMTGKREEDGPDVESIGEGEARKRLTAAYPVRNFTGSSDSKKGSVVRAIVFEF